MGHLLLRRLGGIPSLPPGGGPGGGDSAFTDFDSYGIVGQLHQPLISPLLLVGETEYTWYDEIAEAEGQVHGEIFPAEIGGMDPDEYLNRQYYDQGLCQYQNYYRTGNSIYLGYARKIADSWWASPWFGSGTTNVEDSITPRSSSLGGLILRALDGKPEYWPWIVDYGRFMYQIWIGLRLNYPELHEGVRDGGYTLLYVAWIATSHPDSAIRAEFTTYALAASKDYYARLQYPDGGWYWGAERPTSQPFMIGILLEALVAVHRLTNDSVILTAILNSLEWLWTKAYENTPVTNIPGVYWRAMKYFVYASGPQDVRTDANRYGFFDGAMHDERQLNPETIHAFGYAFSITGNTIYQTRGLEIFASTFGNNIGTNADAYRCLADFREKEYDTAYRSTVRGLAWLEGA